MDSENTKICSCCKEEKSLIDFYMGACYNKNGFSPRCKVCLIYKKSPVDNIESKKSNVIVNISVEDLAVIQKFKESYPALRSEYILKKKKEFEEKRRSGKEKICYVCKQPKKLTEFYNYNTSACKECDKQISREQKKNLTEEQKEKRRVWHRKNQITNGDKINSKRRSQYKNNKEAVAKRRKELRDVDLEKVRMNNKLSYERTKDNRRESLNSRERERRKTDLNYKLAKNIRCRVNGLLRKKYKSASTLALLGCSIDYYKAYLEAKFTKDMTWDVFFKGEIHIDHIRPINSFDLTSSEQQRICFNYKNTQPLWAFDNLSKGHRQLQKTI